MMNIPQHYQNEVFDEPIKGSIWDIFKCANISFKLNKIAPSLTFIIVIMLMRKVLLRQLVLYTLKAVREHRLPGYAIPYILLKMCLYIAPYHYRDKELVLR